MFDYQKKLPFEVLQNAIHEKPAKLEELTLLKVRLWLVLEYFRNGNFRELGTGRGEFPVSDREFPVALVWGRSTSRYPFFWTTVYRFCCKGTAEASWLTPALTRLSACAHTYAQAISALSVNQMICMGAIDLLSCQTTVTRQRSFN